MTGSWLFKHRNIEWRHKLYLFSVVTALLSFWEKNIFRTCSNVIIQYVEKVYKIQIFQLCNGSLQWGKCPYLRKIWIYCIISYHTNTHTRYNYRMLFVQYRWTNPLIWILESSVTCTHQHNYHIDLNNY